MTALPPVLARWARELAGLPAPLVAGVGPWLARLAVAIGPLPGDRHAERGELDGVDGLARRGSYERLLVGEWAIAEVWPDEFLRRAAGGEHLFVARAHRAPPRQRSSVVLVAAGPSQLGAPRLVHVAALVVLARRAAAAGASFRWGVLERPDDGLSEGVDPAALERLLRARTAITAGPAQVAAWQAALGGDDRWVIGGDEHAALARSLGARALVVRDPLDAEASALEVAIDATRLRLALPPNDVAARLIRDPLTRRASPAAPPLTETPRRLWFVQGGKRLAIDLGDRVALWPIPGSPRAPSGHPRIVPVASGDRLLGIGARRRSVIAATWTAWGWQAITLRDDGAGRPRWRAALPIERHTECLTAARLRDWPLPPRGVGFALPLPFAPERLAFSGPDGELVMTAAGDPGTLEVMFDGAPVTAATEVEGALIVVRMVRDRADVMAVSRAGASVVGSVHRELPTGAAAGVVAGCSLPPRGTWGPYAIQVDDRRWAVVEGGATDLTIEASGVAGVVIRSGDVRLLCVDHDVLMLRGRHDGLRLLRASGAIVDAASSPGRHVAYATAEEVVVYSLIHDAPVLRLVRS